MQNKKQKLFEKKKKSLIKKYKDDSVDEIIDRMIMDYEEEGLKLKKENFSLRDFVLSSLLSEGDDEEKKDKKKKTDKKEEKKETPLRKNPDYEFDVHVFVNNVARLAENYDSLLDMRDIILKRAYNFVEKNYSKNVAIEFEKYLMRNFEMQIGRTSIDQEYDFIAPYAKRSGGGSA